MALKQQLAAYYRAAAARGQRLLMGATTPWIKERLGAEIVSCERIAEKIERAAEPSAVARRDQPDLPAKLRDDNPGAAADPPATAVPPG